MTEDFSTFSEEALEALELTGKSLQYVRPPSPLDSLPTFKPRIKPVSREEARAQVASQTSSDLQEELKALREAVQQMQQLAATQAETARAQSLFAPPSQPPSPPVSVAPAPAVEWPVNRPVPATTSVVAPPAEPVVTESVASSEPETWGESVQQELPLPSLKLPVPEMVVQGLKQYISKKQPWKGYRESVWRSGCYRTDRWPADMLAGVEENFNKLIADNTFVTSVAGAVRDIDPGAPVERMFHYVSSTAGWLAWAAYVVNTYGGNDAVPTA